MEKSSCRMILVLVIRPATMVRDTGKHYIIHEKNNDSVTINFICCDFNQEEVVVLLVIEFSEVYFISRRQSIVLVSIQAFFTYIYTFSVNSGTTSNRSPTKP